MSTHACRCNISHNVNPTGAILRISDGVSLASIRSGTISSNIATAVLRLDGRSWVHDPIVFMNATQAIDAGFFRLAEDTSEESYRRILLPALEQQQVCVLCIMYLFCFKKPRSAWL